MTGVVKKILNNPYLEKRGQNVGGGIGCVKLLGSKYLENLMINLKNLKGRMNAICWLSILKWGFKVNRGAERWWTGDFCFSILMGSIY